MITDSGFLTLGWYQQTDLPAIVDFLQIGFPDEEWTINSVELFRQKPGKNNVVKVLFDDAGCLRGVLLYTLTAQHCQLRRIATIEHRQGLGRFMVRQLTGTRSSIKRRPVFADVKETDTPGQLFFQGIGFEFDPHAARVRDSQGMERYRFWLGR